MELWELLAHYKDLIETQLRCDCFEEAMKTFKKIRSFNLDSMNHKDVGNSLHVYNSDPKWKNRKENDINVLLLTTSTIAIMCEQKACTFHGLGDLTNCQLWAQFSVLHS